MNLLIPHGRSSDKYLVRAAQELGHRVHLLCNHHENARMGAVGQACLPDYWVPVESRYKLKLSYEDYQKWHYETIRTYVNDHAIDAMLPCSSMDTVMDEVARVNEEFDLPGIRPEQAAFFRDKTTYLPVMAAMGIPVPKIYEIVEPSGEPNRDEKTYPCIAKPGLGSGGYGIYVAEDEYKLRWFFGDSDDPSAFTERALFYQDRGLAGEPKSYLHFGFGGRYLIQEYLSGPCISIAGCTVDGRLELDMAYDIGITEPPICSEINFGWPAVNKWATIAAEKLLRRINKRIASCGVTFPDGAFMADAILHEGDLYLVDFSPRMSSSGTKMMYHACDGLAYAKDVVHAALGESDQMQGEYPHIPTYYSFIPFPKGNITNVVYPEFPESKDAKLIEKVTPVSNSRLYEMRNDLQVADRGWVVTTAKNESRAVAEKMATDFINNIRYDTD